METIKWVQGIIAFVKVSETGSFSQAAAELHVSKSHISKTIKQLEKDLGIALISRSTRRIQLTNLGEEFLGSCRQSLETLESAKKQVISSSDRPRGVLRVTLAGVFGENFIAPTLISLARKYPDLQVELDFESRIVDIIEKKFDVAIRIGHLKNSSLLAQKIATRREYVCASPKYLETYRAPASPEDLTDHNCLSGGQGSWSFKKSSKPLSVSVKGNFKTNNPRVLVKAALDGLGIVRLPGSYVWDDIKEGKLVSLLERYSEGTKDIWVVTPTRNKLNTNVNVFVEELKKSLERDYRGSQF